MDTNPYLLPNFHNICDKNYSLNSRHHCFAQTSQLDYNGCGLKSGLIAAKHNTYANFYGLSPTLPYFLKRSRAQNNFVAKNCLISCKFGDKHLLITTDYNKIFGLSVEDNQQNCGNSVQTIEFEAKPHIYCRDQSVSYGPFRYCTQDIYDLNSDIEDQLRPIFELKVNQLDENESQIQSNSRNKIRFFQFTTDVNSDPKLDLINELNVEDFGQTDGSLFEFCDRNQIIDNRVLISYTQNNVIDLFDLDTNQTVCTFKSRKLGLKSSQQIGLFWNHSHPMTFFYGQHNWIKYFDARTKTTAIEFFSSGDNQNAFNWEIFYQFLPTKLNSNQVFMATDYHILVTDLRYPKTNLIQLKHMIPNPIMRSLKSLDVTVDGVHTELVVSSNLFRSCLMSFISSSDNCQTLSSKHLPLHTSTPKDIDKQFESYFYRGIELIDSTDNSGFSLALLTNSGDIFIQDFVWNNSEEPETENTDEKLVDRTFSSGVGSSSLELDPKCVQYMTVINSFLNDLKLEVAFDYQNYTKCCLECNLNRVCKQVDGLCVCRDFYDYTIEIQTSGRENDTDRNQLFQRLSKKYFNEEILINKQRLENPELLLKTTDSYTKKILELWDT